MRRLTNILKIFKIPFLEYVKGLLFSFTILSILCLCLHPGRFASHYNCIKRVDIPAELERAYDPSNKVCTLNFTNSLNLLYPNENIKEEPTSLARKLQILPGGQWKPKNCYPLFNLAIILPYRNRLSQLEIFMNFIHPFLQFQKLEYRIFVIEQSSNKDFNRAKLFNVGFLEATKFYDFHCFIFHDIDLIPQNLNNIYACTKMPRHMSSSVNTFRYNLPYQSLFGGAIAILRYQFEKVNGFSNIFYGWGGEDDDFYNRLQSKGYEVLNCF